MATKKFACVLCDMEFDYQSRYQRHLDSASHKRFSSIQFPGSDQDEPMDMMTEDDVQDVPHAQEEEEDSYLYQVFVYRQLARLFRLQKLTGCHNYFKWQCKTISRHETLHDEVEYFRAAKKLKRKRPIVLTTSIVHNTEFG